MMTSKIILPKRNLVLPHRAIFIPRGATLDRQRGFFRLMPSLALAGRQFATKGIEFDGSTHSLTRASAFSGGAAHTQGVMSFWARLDTDAQRWAFYANQDSSSYATEVWYDNSTNRIVFTLGTHDSTGTTGTDFGFTLHTGTNSFLAGGGWSHFLLAYKSNGMGVAPSLQLYLNGSSALNVIAQDMFGQYFRGNDTDIRVGDGSARWDGGIAEFFWEQTQYPDFSIAANLHKFRTAQGKPADLGPGGIFPFGVKPTVYLTGRHPAEPARFALNYAGNGDFTFNGTPTFSATTPSD